MECHKGLITAHLEDGLPAIGLTPICKAWSSAHLEGVPQPDLRGTYDHHSYKQLTNCLRCHPHTPGRKNPEISPRVYVLEFLSNCGGERGSLGAHLPRVCMWAKSLKLAPRNFTANCFPLKREVPNFKGKDHLDVPLEVRING